MWFPTVLVYVVLSTLSQGCASKQGAHRSLLGQEAIFSREVLDIFDVPPGAELLLQSETNCSQPPPLHFAPKLALICQGTTKLRECMGVGQLTTIFIGHDCQGDRCKMTLTPGPASCLLENFGVRLNQSDPALSSTCGIREKDIEWLNPNPSPVQLDTDDETDCLNSIPNGGATSTWVECNDGKLGDLHFAAYFPERIVKRFGTRKYSCKVSTACFKDHVGPKSRVLCYSKEKSREESETLLDVGHLEGGSKDEGTAEKALHESNANVAIVSLATDDEDENPGEPKGERENGMTSNGGQVVTNWLTGWVWMMFSLGVARVFFWH